MNRSPLMTGLVTLLMLTVGCAGTPTSPTPQRACSTAGVFEGQTFYVERPEAEGEFRGTLELRDLPATPSGRDHRYFLDGVPVYSGGGATEASFRSATGEPVVIRGKLVHFTHGPEIWTAALTVCR